MLSPFFALSVFFPQMRMWVINRINLQNIFYNLASHMNHITIEPFTSYKIAVKPPIVYMLFDNLTSKNRIFDILQTNLTRSTFIPTMSSQSVVICFYKLPYLSQTHGLPFRF